MKPSNNQGNRQSNVYDGFFYRRGTKMETEEKERERRGAARREVGRDGGR